MRDRVAKWLVFCRLKYSGQRILSGNFVISLYSKGLSNDFVFNPVP
jgi:hypothetical protein